MKKIVRIGTIEDQDKIRRDDIKNIHPNKRVEMLLIMQRKFLKWDENPVIERVATKKW